MRLNISKVKKAKTVRLKVSLGIEYGLTFFCGIKLYCFYIVKQIYEEIFCFPTT